MDVAGPFDRRLTDGRSVWRSTKSASLEFCLLAVRGAEDARTGALRSESRKHVEPRSEVAATSNRRDRVPRGNDVCARRPGRGERIEALRADKGQRRRGSPL